MVLRALRGCESYAWTTTSQSKYAERLFPALTVATGIVLPDSTTGEQWSTARGDDEPATPRLERCLARRTARPTQEHRGQHAYGR
jgi:hypothetical protein